MYVDGVIRNGSPTDVVTIEYRRKGVRRWSKVAVNARWSPGWWGSTGPAIAFEWYYRPKVRGTYQVRVRFGGGPWRTGTLTGTRSLRLRW